MTYQNDTLVQQFIDADNLRSDLHILKSDLSASLSTQAGLYFHYAEQSVRARQQLDKFKARLELVRSSLNRAYRTKLTEDAKAAGDPKPKITIDQIEAAVQLDSNFVKMQQAVIEAEAVFRLSEAAVFSFVQRKDMLVQLSRNDSSNAGTSARVTSVGSSYLDASRNLRQSQQAGQAPV